VNFITDWQFPTVAENDTSIGTDAWTTPEGVYTDNIYGDYPWAADSSIFVTGADEIRYRKAHLVLADVIDTANNEAGNQNALVVHPDPRTFGSSSDLWGATLTPADINLDTFGVALALSSYDVGSLTYGDEGNYLVAQGFGFNIPDGATIAGIEAKFDGYAENGGGGTQYVALNYVQVRVHYTWDPVIAAEGIGSGAVYFDVDDDHRPPLRKRYRHMIYEHAGDYIGDWKQSDIANDPSFKRDVNNLITTMNVELTRNELYQPKSVESLLTEADAVLLTEADEPILIDIQTGGGLGEGTDVEVNHDVEIDVFYGEYEPLLTEDGYPIMTEDDQLIMVEDGYPHGRALFTGYINTWELGFGTGNENVTVELMSHSQELDDIMLETDDTAVVSFTGTDGETTIGITGNGPSDRTGLGHTFTQVGNESISGLSYRMRGWGSTGGTVRVRATLKVGAPGAAGAILATSEITIPNGFADDLQELRFPFDDYIPLTNTTVYGVEFEITTADSKTGGGSTYPAQWECNYSGGYSGGQVYEIIAGGSWASTAYDLWFKVWKAGGDTTVIYEGLTPSQIAARIIDFARSRGWRGNYSLTSIAATTEPVEIEFNTNTCLDALNKIPELCPDGFYQTYDPGENIYYLLERSEEPEMYLTKGLNVNQLRVKKSIADLANLGYFSGGDIGGGVNLYRKVTDSASIGAWRRGLLKLSDNRVKDADSADILTQAEIDRLKNPQYTGALVMIDQRGFYIEDVVLGVQAGFINFGTLVDALGLQLRSITYTPDTLTSDLNSLPPKLAKRVEDIKRALALLEQKDNPSAPS
jgi:hypothetical protein